VIATWTTSRRSWHPDLLFRSLTGCRRTRYQPRWLVSSDYLPVPDGSRTATGMSA